MKGRREINKELRREAILDAALELLDQAPNGDLTTQQIAAKAGVSHATVFNLVGTRQELLRAVMDRRIAAIGESIEELRGLVDDQPIEAALQIFDRAVDGFTTQPVALRRIVNEVAVGLPPIGKGRPMRYLIGAMRSAQDHRIVRDDFDPVGLGVMLVTNFVSSLIVWASEKIDDEGFLLSVRCGLFTVLAAVAVEAHQAQFRRELAELTRRYAVLYNESTEIDLGRLV